MADVRPWLRRVRRVLTRATHDAGLARHPWRTPGPVSRVFGLDRGTPIDRVYIEAFLAAHAADIRGRVLEIGDDTYARRFGGGVTQVDVVHHGLGAPAGVTVADLADAPALASATYDCAIVTQTLQHLPDPRRAAATLARILRPGGVALVSVPGISQISRFDADRWGDYWRFTTQALHEVLGREFAGGLDVTSCGSAWTAVAFLEGLAAEDLGPGEIDWHDPDYEVVVLARAVKA